LEKGEREVRIALAGVVAEDLLVGHDRLRIMICGFA